MHKAHTPKERLVVIGNGMAGCRAIEEILKRDPDRYVISVFGAEPRVNYNRIMLSPVLAGEKSFEQIVINDLDWYRDNAITLHSGRAVVRIDAQKKVVEAEGGLLCPYDRLILACGSDPVRLPLPGASLDGVVKCPFVVVSEAMAETDTTAFAHVKLPALTWGERDGTVTNSERRISRQRPLFTAPGEARADWRIVADVAGRMGHGDAFNWRSSAEVFREYAALVWRRVVREACQQHEFAGRGDEIERGHVARMLSEDAQGELLSLDDVRTGLFRRAWIKDGRLEHALFITQGRLPPRDWLISLFEQETLDAQDRISLLAGRPLGPVEDVGRMVCACLKVGEKAIQRAIEAGAESVEAVGAGTRAGTNCGSCRVEIARLLKPMETRHAA